MGNNSLEDPTGAKFMINTKDMQLIGVESKEESKNYVTIPNGNPTNTQEVTNKPEIDETDSSEFQPYLDEEGDKE